MLQQFKSNIPFLTTKDTDSPSGIICIQKSNDSNAFLNNFSMFYITFRQIFKIIQIELSQVGLALKFNTNEILYYNNNHIS